MPNQPAPSPATTRQAKRCPCNLTGCRVADRLTAKVAAVNAVESVFAAACAEYDEALSECLERWRAQKGRDRIAFESAYHVQGAQ